MSPWTYESAMGGVIILSPIGAGVDRFAKLLRAATIDQNIPRSTEVIFTVGIGCADSHSPTVRR